MQESDRPPKALLQFIFLLLGVGILAPWNAFISAKDYFDRRLCSMEKFSASANLESNFSLTYNLASVFSLAVVMLLQAVQDRASGNDGAPVIDESTSEQDDDPLSDPTQHDCETKNNSFWLVVAPLSLYLAAFLSQTGMVCFVKLKAFFLLTYTSLALCGMSCSVAQVGIVATAGLFRPEIAMSPYLFVSPALATRS